MNYKRIGRALICLVLVCALLVNVSPIKAEALVPESMVISAGLVVGSILVGLGIGMASDSTANVISGLVDDCISVIQSDYDFIDEEGLVEIYTDYSAATAQYYVNQAMVEAVREWMFESETVSDGIVEVAPEYVSGNCVYAAGQSVSYKISGSYVNTSSTIPYSLIGVRSSHGSPAYYESCVFAVSDVSGVVRGGTGATLSKNSIYGCYVGCISRNAGEGGPYVIDAGFPVIDLGNFSSSSDASSAVYNYICEWFLDGCKIKAPALVVSEGLTAHQIAPKDEDFSTGYPVWSGGAISIPREGEVDEPVIGVPVGLAPTLDETFTLTQEDVQKGVSTLEQGGGDITDPDDGNNDDTGGLKLGEITVTAFVARLLADLTRAILGDRFTSLEDLWGSKWIEVQNSLGELQSAISQLLTQIETSIQNMTSSLSDVLSQTMTSMKTGFENLTQSLTSSLTDLKTSLQNLSQTLTQALEDLKTDILQGVKSLFVPKEGYLDSKIDDLKDKYKFAETLADSSLKMKKFLLSLGQQPPIIYIDLGAASGSYVWGSRTIFIDLTWYAQYKGTMDAILSAFLWLWFVWRLTLSLPGIIQGTSGFWNSPDPYVGIHTWTPQQFLPPPVRGNLTDGDHPIGIDGRFDNGFSTRVRRSGSRHGFHERDNRKKG